MLIYALCCTTNVLVGLKGTPRWFKTNACFLGEEAIFS